MKKECLLHIGTNKTGSTTIQFLLSQNRERLITHSILFPKALGNNGGRFATLVYKEIRPIVRRLLDVADEDSHRRFVQQTQRDLDQEIASVNPARMIISSEGASNFTDKEIADAAEFLHARFECVRILAYVRDPLDHVISNYTTQLLHGRTSDFDIQQPLKNFLRAFRTYRDIFGKANCIFRPFHRAAWENGDFVTDFLSVAKLAQCDLNLTNKPKNVSVSRHGQEVMKRFNLCNPAEDKATRLKRQALKRFLTTHCPGSGGVPSLSEAKDFVSRNDSYYEALEQEFLGGFRFPRDFSRYPAESPALELEKVVDIALAYADELYSRSTPSPK